MNALVDAVNSSGHLLPADFATVGAVASTLRDRSEEHELTISQNTQGSLVLSQCDHLDGLLDGIIVNPRHCKPDLTPLSCESATANQSSCLTPAKIDTMYQIYSNWTSSTGEWLFPGYEPGAEASPTFTVTGVPFSRSFFSVNGEQLLMKLDFLRCRSRFFQLSGPCFVP